MNTVLVILRQVETSEYAELGQFTLDSLPALIESVGKYGVCGEVSEVAGQYSDIAEVNGKAVFEITYALA